MRKILLLFFAFFLISCDSAEETAKKADAAAKNGDEELAFELYEKAAGKGHAESQHRLCMAYSINLAFIRLGNPDKSEIIDRAKNVEKWCKKAAKHDAEYARDAAEVAKEASKILQEY